jgi:membrane protein YdbS with pleckstrin-like domain
MEKEDKPSISYKITYKTSRLAYLPNYILALVIIVLLIYLFPNLNLNETASALFAFICVAIALILVVEPQIERILRQYLITDTEVVKMEGILRKKRIDIPMQKVADINLQKGILGRIFNFGNVKITGFKNEIEMKGIRHPEGVYELLKNRVKIKNKSEN